MPGDKSNKNQKYGRNKVKCGAYRVANRRVLNAAKRLSRHARRHCGGIAGLPPDAAKAWRAATAVLPNSTVNNLTTNADKGKRACP